MNQLEHVGALYIETQRLLEEYRKLLGLLSRAKAGEVQLSQIEIDEPGLKWTLVLTAADLQPAAKTEAA